MTARDQRQFGTSTRLNRHDIPADQLDEVIQASMFRDWITRPEPVRRYLSSLLDED